MVGTLRPVGWFEKRAVLLEENVELGGYVLEKKDFGGIFDPGIPF